MVRTRSGVSVDFQQPTARTTPRRRKRLAPDTDKAPATRISSLQFGTSSHVTTTSVTGVASERRQKRQKMDDQNHVKKRLRQEVMKEIRPIALGSLAMLASTLSNQAVPRLLGMLLDHKSATTSSSVPVSQSTVSSLAMVVLGGGLASFVRTTMLNRAEDSIASRLRTDVFRALLTERSLEWFQVGSVGVKGNEKQETDGEPAAVSTKDGLTGLTPGAIAAVMNEDVRQVAKSLTVNFASLIRSSCSCIFGTYHMLRLNAGLFGLSFSIVPTIGAAAMVLRKIVKRVTVKQRETATLAASFAEERLLHIAMVKMSNRDQDEVHHFAELQEECARLGQRVSLANGAFMGFIFAASSGALFLVFNAGGKAIAAGRMTAGDLTSFATYSFLLGLGTSGIFKSWSEIMQSMVSAKRVYGLMDGALDNEPVREATECHDMDVSSVECISLSTVNFAYLSNPLKNVLVDVSLELKRGVVCALVGENGSGKSTLASLLTALYLPQSGRIFLSPGNIDYNALDRVVQKQLVQVVPQCPVLFNTSILENVRYTKPDASREEVELALKMANGDSFLLEQDGLDYQVGQSGCKLSGGQRARIGLARALLADPTLLVLDEPTSSLDLEGESSVADAVLACRGRNGTTGRALLLITHRSKSLELADIVVVLEKGKIIEAGPLSELRSDSDGALCRLMPDL